MIPTKHSTNPSIHPIGSVSALRDQLAQACPQHQSMVEKLLGEYDPAQSADLDWLKHYNVNHEARRVRLLTARLGRPAKQLACNTVCLALVLICSAMLVEALTQSSLLQRLRILSDCLGFAMERRWADIVAHCLAASEDEVASKIWQEREEFEMLQRHFRLGDSVLAGVQAHAEPEMLVLEMQDENPRAAFSGLLQDARGTAALTQMQFAQRFNVKQVAISSWERGTSFPRWSQRNVVMRMATELNRPALLKAYDVQRAHINAIKPVAMRSDIRYADYVSPGFQPTLDMIEEYDRARPKRGRKGKRYSMGDLAENSKANYRRILFTGFAAMQLPVDGPPRMQGLGLPAHQATIIDLLHMPVRTQWLQLLLARGERSHIAYSDKLPMIRMAFLCAPKTGFYWIHAKALVDLHPEAIERCCPMEWPEGADQPGSPATTPIDRLRALCYEAHAWFEERADAASYAPFSPHHLKKLTTLLDSYPRPLCGVIILLRRIPSNGTNTTPDKFHAMMICCYLALACYHPPRTGDGLLYDSTTAYKDRDGTIMLYFKSPVKNEDSALGCVEIREIFPRALVRFVLPYLKLRNRMRCANDPKAFFVSADGQTLTAATLYHQLDRVVRHYAPDIFPTGINPHYLRHIVSTDLCVRFGMERGVGLASLALRDAEGTVRKSYVLTSNLDEYKLVRGDITRKRAIQDAAREARKQPLPPATRMPRHRRPRHAV